VQHWLLVRGRGDRRLDAEVRPEELRAHSSTRRPAIRAGDLAILYAAGWQVVFAAVEITGDPEHDPTKVRWAWRFPIRPVLAIRDLREAPPVEAAGVFPRSLGRHSYVRLGAEGYDNAWQAIADAA